MKKLVKRTWKVYQIGQGRQEDERWVWRRKAKHEDDHRLDAQTRSALLDYRAQTTSPGRVNSGRPRRMTGSRRSTHHCLPPPSPTNKTKEEEEEKKKKEFHFASFSIPFTSQQHPHSHLQHTCKQTKDTPAFAQQTKGRFQKKETHS